MNCTLCYLKVIKSQHDENSQDIMIYEVQMKMVIVISKNDIKNN